MRQDSTPQRKRISGFQRRKMREQQGLPRYTPKEKASRTVADRERNRQAVDERRRLVARIKLERGCVDCGYRSHAVALQFDHLPGSEKITTVTRLAGYSRTPLDRLLAEIAKCEVVCANCHAVRTATRRHHLAEQELASPIPR